MGIKVAVIIIMVAMQLFDFFLKYLNYTNRNTPLPENVKDIFDPETYAKRSAYEMEHVRLSIVSGLCNLVLIAAILGFNVHSSFFNFMGQHTGNLYLQVYFMFAMTWLIGLPLSAIFDAIKTFKIEAKYGFNKSSVGTFLGDIIKDAIINGIIGLGLMSLFILIHGILGNGVFVAFIFVVAAFIVIFIFIRPVTIRIFNKLTPLEEGPLKERVMALSREADFPVMRVYSVDGSKRTTKANAFFSGLGKSRFIGLYDNLINDYSEDEVIYVLGHEIGHAKKKHIRRRLPLMLLVALPILALAYFVVNTESVSLAFGFYELNVAFGLYIGMALAAPFIMFLQWPFTALSRKHEYEADAYGIQFTGSEPGITAMKKMSRLNYANLTPHPFVVTMTYSHPPISQRIAAMEALKAQEKAPD
ncbi:MAG: M48 family metallopeptidase [Defluviitaleaceae bacterium]|nr:M48 family metallopeptidase [Defluviitaleaceae bacterium]